MKNMKIMKIMKIMKSHKTAGFYPFSIKYIFEKAQEGWGVLPLFLPKNSGHITI